MQNVRCFFHYLCCCSCEEFPEVYDDTSSEEPLRHTHIDFNELTTSLESGLPYYITDAKIRELSYRLIPILEEKQLEINGLFFVQETSKITFFHERYTFPILNIPLGLPEIKEEDSGIESD